MSFNRFRILPNDGSASSNFGLTEHEYERMQLLQAIEQSKAENNTRFVNSIESNGPYYSASASSIPAYSLPRNNHMTDAEQLAFAIAESQAEEDKRIKEEVELNQALEESKQSEEQRQHYADVVIRDLQFKIDFGIELSKEEAALLTTALKQKKQEADATSPATSALLPASDFAQLHASGAFLGAIKKGIKNSSVTHLPSLETKKAKEFEEIKNHAKQLIDKIFLLEKQNIFSIVGTVTDEIFEEKITALNYLMEARLRNLTQIKSTLELDKFIKQIEQLILAQENTQAFVDRLDALFAENLSLLEQIRTYDRREELAQNRFDEVSSFYGAKDLEGLVKFSQDLTREIAQCKLDLEDNYSQGLEKLKEIAGDEKNAEKVQQQVDELNKLYETKNLKDLRAFLVKLTTELNNLREIKQRETRFNLIQTSLTQDMQQFQATWQAKIDNIVKSATNGILTARLEQFTDRIPTPVVDDASANPVVSLQKPQAILGENQSVQVSLVDEYEPLEPPIPVTSLSEEKSFIAPQIQDTAIKPLPPKIDFGNELGPLSQRISDMYRDTRAQGDGRSKTSYLAYKSPIRNAYLPSDGNATIYNLRVFDGEFGLQDTDTSLKKTCESFLVSQPFRK